jgi:3-methyl-2-oxobutanoate hydroxymethyltransferase
MSITIRDLRSFKERGERFIMLTAYDFPTARILDEAGVPVILVGDSLAQNVLGYSTTLPVTMEEMLHHTRAVTRGAKNALIVGDMPSRWRVRNSNCPRPWSTGASQSWAIWA